MHHRSLERGSAFFLLTILLQDLEPMLMATQSPQLTGI